MIMLQDVAIILGLCIHGPTVTRRCVFNVAELCGELLGVTPPVDALRGSTISIRWLCDQLSNPTPEAYEVTLEQSVRGFILALMRSFLFTNNKGVHVHLCFLPLLRELMQTVAYSWGSVILAQLCQASLDRRRNISGCITLLQVSITLVYYIHIYIHNTSLVCLLFVYFVFSYGLMRDFTWGD